MIFLSRFIDGITAGKSIFSPSLYLGRDTTQRRAKAFGIIGISFGIGLSPGSRALWLSLQFGYQYPPLAAATLSLTILSALLFSFPRMFGFLLQAHKKN